MKNILWIGGIYAASLLAQLLTALLFLFLPWDHLAGIVLAGVFPIPGLVRGLAALVLIVTCICGVLLLWRAGKPEEETAASEEFREPGEDA